MAIVVATGPKRLPAPIPLIVDAEFQAIIPPLRDAEKRQLEANLLANGCRDSLVIWQNCDGCILLDGKVFPA